MPAHAKLVRIIMELVIESATINLRKEYLLSDEKYSVGRDIVLRSDFKNIITQSFFPFISGYDTCDCLKYQPTDVLMVLAYFLLKEHITPESIITKYLIDAGCTKEATEYLLSLYRNAFFDTAFRDNVHSMNKQKHKVKILDYPSIPELLKLMTQEPGQFYWHLSTNEHIDSYPEVSLHHLPESHFFVQDNGVTFFGICNPVSQFLELLADTNNSLFDYVSHTVPIGLRDEYSLGHLIRSDEHYLNLMIKKYGFTLWGLDLNSKLKQISSLDSIKTHLSYCDNLIPLYFTFSSIN